MKKFVVDENCIACDACTIEAPGFFSMNEDEGCAFVSTQPKNKSEEEVCNEALEACPVEAISFTEG